MRYFLPLIAVVLGFCQCSPTPHDITSGYVPYRTALDYAYECEDALGPLPKFSCADAIEVPTTKDGVPLTFPGGEEGSGSTDPSDCDHPWAFGMACQTGNRVGRYQGLNVDGSENTDVVFITFCRDGGLGVIGYKFSTGETCFFSIIDGADSNNTPLPGETGYNDSWMSPQVVADDRCMNCHMADPFLHTPAIDQLKIPNTDELLVPITANGPYTIIGAEFQQPITANFDNNQCVSCHRPQCTTHFQNYPLDELVMPPPFLDATNFDHSNIANADRQAIRDWCATLGL
jgi:hypothetical protein